MKEAFVYVLLGLVAFGFGVGAILATSGTPEHIGSAHSSEERYLYSQSAAAGTLAETTAGSYSLTLSGVSTTMIAFSDRPFRDAFNISTSNFVSTFDTVFGPDAPNAELSFEASQAGVRDSIVIVLEDPTYDEEAGTLTYGVTTVPTPGVDEAQLPATFGPAHLFIDDGSPSLQVLGTVTDEAGDPLPGVTVTGKSPYYPAVSAVTRDDGSYRMAIPKAKEAMLTFTMTSMQTVKMQVDGSESDLDVVMKVETDLET